MAKAKKKNTFKVGETTYELRTPTQYDIKQAQRHYNRKFAELIKDPDMLTIKQMTDKLKEKGVWDDEKDEAIKTLTDSILEMEKKLEAGGIEIEEAKDLAYKIFAGREQIMTEYAVLNSMLSYTVEQCSETFKQEYMLYRSIFQVDSGERYCKSFEEFLEKANDDEVISSAFEASVGEVDTNGSLDQLPEIQFLKEYGFVDDKYQNIVSEEDSTEEKKTKKPFLRDGKPVACK